MNEIGEANEMSAMIHISQVTIRKLGTVSDLDKTIVAVGRMIMLPSV
jgi:hypothetical protein